MTNPKKNRKVFNIILAIVLAVGVWLYVINVENPTGTVPIRDLPVCWKRSSAREMVADPHACSAQSVSASRT